MPHDRTNRQKCESAHSFETTTCNDPGCGLHLLAFRSDGSPICEIVIGREAVGEMLRFIHDRGLDL